MTIIGDVLVYGMRDVVRRAVGKPTSAIDMFDFSRAFLAQRASVALFIDLNGEVKILKCRFGGEELHSLYDCILDMDEVTTLY